VIGSEQQISITVCAGRHDNIVPLCAGESEKPLRGTTHLLIAVVRVVGRGLQVLDEPGPGGRRFYD